MKHHVFPTLIFDLDQTLVECTRFYVDAKTQFVQFQHGRTGLPIEFIDNLLGVIDIAALKGKNPMSPERFPSSFRATSYALDSYLHQVPDIEAGTESYRIGDTVFDAEYPMYEGVHDLLDRYSDGGWLLAVLTKGDQQVQERKLKINNLSERFDGVFITPEKSAEVLNWAVWHLKADPKRTWVIGDSIRDDIVPAETLGLGRIHVERADAWHAYETVANQSHITKITGLDQLPDFIPVDSQSKRSAHGKSPKTYEPEIRYNERLERVGAPTT